MSSKYILTVSSMGASPVIEIRGEDFSRLKQSRNILSHALAIEEKYEILVSNYMELEKKSISNSVSAMIRSKTEYGDFFELRLALNIKVVNLLTSVRLYTDQLTNHTRSCVPDDPQIKEKTKKLFSTEYDKWFEYRFMEALRNHVQHRGMPVHSVMTNAEENSDGLWVHSLYFTTRKHELILEGGFKKAILFEMPDDVNLLFFVRSYIRSISLIHAQARDLIEENVFSAREALDKKTKEYELANKNKRVLGLTAYETKDGNKTDEVMLWTPFDDSRIRLIKRNTKLDLLTKSYATNQLDIR